jgi:GntR family transcriptional regulator
MVKSVCLDRETAMTAANKTPSEYYRKVADDIIRRIQEREWRVDDKLPPTWELAQQYHCSATTINKALSTLILMGIVEGGRGGRRRVIRRPRRLPTSDE